MSSEDEYANLPDITAGVDLDAIAALCAPEQPAQDDGSSEYSFDELDDDALAEVARVEAAALVASDTPATAQDTPRHPPHANGSAGDTPAQPAWQGQSQHTDSPPFTPPPKRPRPGPSSPARKRRAVSPSGARPAHAAPRSPAKAERPLVNSGPSVEKVLAEYEDELTCPICCDLFVCAHLGNPCGHSFCGDCGWDWISKNLKAPTCASCRCPLSKERPMLPNFALDSAVRKHVEALGKSGVAGWEMRGARFLEWEDRQKKWRAGDAKRTRLTSEINAAEEASAAAQGESPHAPIFIGSQPG